MIEPTKSLTKINYIMLTLRLWLGIIMLKHSGTYLFQGKVPELAAYLDSLHWPFPLLMAYSSQLAEFFASILILLGFRLGALIMAFTLGIAVAFAHSGKIFTEAELPFNYFLMSILIFIYGNDKFTLKNLMLNKNKKQIGH